MTVISDWSFRHDNGIDDDVDIVAADWEEFNKHPRFYVDMTAFDLPGVSLNPDVVDPASVIPLAMFFTEHSTDKSESPFHFRNLDLLAGHVGNGELHFQASEEGESYILLARPRHDLFPER